MNGTHVGLRFEDFDISYKTGFVPETQPLTRLPEYFERWERIVDEVPTLISERRIRQEIANLPKLEFSSDTLKSLNEWRRAYNILTLLSQSFIWVDGEKGLVKRLPEVLAKPWHSVSERVGVPPIITYASTVLYNWGLRDPSAPIDLDNLFALHTFTGTEDESWFYMVAIPIELEAVPGMKAMLNSISAMLEHDHNLLSDALHTIATSLDKMRFSLNRMYEQCDPKCFYVNVRPFQAGSKGLEAFPEGLVYEGVDEKPLQFSGASAAQSSCVHCFDIFLGAQHAGDHESFLKSMRTYMPVKHRQFLEALSEQPSVREYVRKSKDSRLVKSFNDAVEAFGRFRSDHVILVTRYIVMQKSHSINASLEEKGTGGTPFMLFLKQVRDDTLALKISDEDSWVA